MSRPVPVPPYGPPVLITPAQVSILPPSPAPYPTATDPHVFCPPATTRSPRSYGAPFKHSRARKPRATCSARPSAKPSAKPSELRSSSAKCRPQGWSAGFREQPMRQSIWSRLIGRSHGHPSPGRVWPLSNAGSDHSSPPSARRSFHDSAERRSEEASTGPRGARSQSEGHATRNARRGRRLHQRGEDERRPGRIAPGPLTRIPRPSRIPEAGDPEAERGRTNHRGQNEPSGRTRSPNPRGRQRSLSTGSRISRSEGRRRHQGSHGSGYHNGGARQQSRSRSRMPSRRRDTVRDTSRSPARQATPNQKVLLP